MKYQLPPKLLFVFSYSNPDSLKYFMTFEKLRKQLECEGVLLEFRLMDIGKRQNSLGKIDLLFLNFFVYKLYTVFIVRSLRRNIMIFLTCFLYAVISRHINGTKINRFPVFVLFWQEMTETYGKILTDLYIL